MVAAALLPASVMLLPWSGPMARKMRAEILEAKLESLPQVGEGGLDRLALACDLDLQALSDVPGALACDRRRQAHEARVALPGAITPTSTPAFPHTPSAARVCEPPPGQPGSRQR